MTNFSCDIDSQCLEVRSLNELCSRTHIPRILLSAFDGLYNVLTEGGQVTGGFNVSKIYFCAGRIINAYAKIQVDYKRVSVPLSS